MNDWRLAVLSETLVRSSSLGGKGERPMLEEFKKFIMRGNVVDLAVGVIIGVAFGAIVTSLVSDIIMPIIVRSPGDSTSRITISRCPRRFSQAWRMLMPKSKVPCSDGVNS